MTRAPMRVEKPRQAGLGVAEDRPRGQRQQREEIGAGARLQPAVEPQGRRGLEASRPQCAIRAHQRPGDRRPGGEAGQPVISVDTKKKELIGNYKNGGTDYRRKGDPRRVKVHDFEDKQLGKVVPYGVYDVGANAGWVSVGSQATRVSSPSLPSAAGSTQWVASAT